MNAARNAQIAAGLPARASQASCSSCDTRLALALGFGVRLRIGSRAGRVVVRVVRLHEPRQPLARSEHDVEARRGEADDRLEPLAHPQLVRREMGHQPPLLWKKNSGIAPFAT